MPIIQRPDIVAKIRKTYELLGPDAIATISPELVPVVVVDDISERDPSSGTLFAYGRAQRTAVAGQYSEVALWNPADSGIDVYVLAMNYWDISGNQTYNLAYFNAALGTRATVVNTGMGAAGGSSAFPCAAAAAVPVGAPIGQYYSNQGSDQFPHTFPWRIPPGEGIGFSNNAVNRTSEGTWYWSEQPAR